MNIIKRFKKNLNLSIVSFLISFFLLNLLSQFISLEYSLRIVLIILFFFNFFRLKNIYVVKNSQKFFIFFLILIVFSRIIEYILFNYIYLIILDKNISWLITISISFILKFVYLEILNHYKI